MPASLKVVDASALGALLFGEPRAAEVAERLERCELARHRRLTVYDAAYLWLARSLDAELVTFDRKLARAVR